MNKSKRAIFLDRDGTINIERNYLFRCEDFAFIPGVPQALRRLQCAGYLLVVVTNQSGVARCYFDLADVEKLHTHLRRLLLDHGVTLDGVYVCPHHPAGVKDNPFSVECDCRKGSPGMLLTAADDLAIDLSRSYMIGDKNSDLEAGYRAGCHPFLVTTDYGNGKPTAVPEYCQGVFAGLAEAAEHILQLDRLETAP